MALLGSYVAGAFGNVTVVVYVIECEVYLLHN